MPDKSDLQKRFSMRRPNFILDPLSEEDSAFFADRTGVNVGHIIENLQVDLATELPPKRMFWGPYGGGKTHTLQYTMRKLKSMLEIHPVYVECPNLSKRSAFVDLYREGIMRSLGQDFVLELFEEARNKAGFAPRDELLKKLRDILQDEELAKATAILIDPSEERKLLLWSWFSGIPIPRSSLSELGQTQDLSSAEPSRLAQNIIILGKLVRELLNRSLIIILDEMDRITVVTDTIIQFQTALTRLMDPNQKYVSILLGCSAETLTGMPDIFSGRSPIMSRLGSDAVLQIPMMDEPDAKPFMKKIIEYVRDTEADINKLIQEAKSHTSETLSKDFFPFSNEAIEAIKMDVGREMTPRELTLKMTRAAGKAYNYGKFSITSDIIT